LKQQLNWRISVKALFPHSGGTSSAGYLQRIKQKEERHLRKPDMALSDVHHSHDSRASIQEAKTLNHKQIVEGIEGRITQLWATLCPKIGSPLALSWSDWML